MVHEILGEPMFKPAPHRPRGIPRRKPFGTLVVPLLWVGKIVEKSWLVIEKLWIPSELAVQELLALAWQRGDQSAPPLLDAVGVGTLDQPPLEHFEGLTAALTCGTHAAVACFPRLISGRRAAPVRDDRDASSWRELLKHVHTVRATGRQRSVFERGLPYVVPI